MTDVEKLKRDVKILTEHNEWRRGKGDRQPHTALDLGVATETAIEVMEKLILVSEK